MYRLPSNVPTELGALIEPLSVAIHGVRRAALAPGSTTLVIGAGAVGLLTAAMLRVAAASTNIVICDIEAKRVEFATTHEFADKHFVVSTERGSTIEEKLTIARDTAASALQAAGEGADFGGFDAVFECTGVEACMQTAIYVCAL